MITIIFAYRILAFLCFWNFLSSRHMSRYFSCQHPLRSSIKLRSQTSSRNYALSSLARPDDIPDEVDYVIIGSGIGGLSAAAMLSYYGYEVAVFESHYLAGGVAHSFVYDGFKFDAG